MITIIVVLLALLTPALDRAIYQAELAVCGAGGKGQVSSLTLYAMDYTRRYPDRPLVDARGNWRADWIRFDTNHDANYDDRPKLDPYMDINGLLNCPMRQAVDYEAGGEEDPHVLYAGYSLFYGWSFMNADGVALKGLKRLGDHYTWAAGSGANERTYRLTVLSADVDVLWDANFYHASHPDKEGLMSPIVVQSVPSGVLGMESRETASFYALYGAAAADRGPVDRNFAFTDGSVDRLIDLEPIDESRTIEVPVGPAAHSYPRPYRTMLPPR